MGTDCIHWDLDGDLEMLVDQGAPPSLLLILICVGVLYDRNKAQNNQFCAARKLMRELRNRNVHSLPLNKLVGFKVTCFDLNTLSLAQELFNAGIFIF